MPVTSNHWSEAVDPTVREAFWLGYGNAGADGVSRRASLIPTLYDVGSSESAFEKFFGVGVVGTEGWNLDETGRVQASEPKKGFEKTFSHPEFAHAIILKRKFVDDNQMSGFFDNARALGDAAWRKREKGAASVFNNATASSGTNADGFSVVGPDGVALVSDSHPLSAEDSAVQDNKFALSLTKDNVGTVRQAMQAFTDSSGDLMDVMPDTLLVPPELEDDALVISRSLLDPTSGNNAINPQAGRFNVVVWHYLTDSNRWFLIDSGRRSRMLKWFDRIPLEFDQREDRETHQVTYDAYGRWSYGFTDWAWIAGSEAS